MLTSNPLRSFSTLVRSECASHRRRICHVASSLRTRPFREPTFRPPEPQIIGKHCFASFLPFADLYFFRLALSSNLFPFFVPLGSPLGVWMTATHLCWHSEMSSSYFVRSGSPTRPEGGTPMNFTIKMNRKLKTENSSSKGSCPLHLGVKRMPSDISSDLKRSSWYALWRSWISQNGIFFAYSIPKIHFTWYTRNVQRRCTFSWPMGSNL